MIAVIAGTGTLPAEACRLLAHAGEHFFVVALFPEDNIDLLRSYAPATTAIFPQEVCKPSKILALLKEQATTKVLLIGKVDKGHLLKKMAFDTLALSMLGSVFAKNDKDLMERVIQEIAGNDILVLKQDDILAPLLVSPGILTGIITPEIENDITVGLQTASVLSEHGIGQSVVIKDTMVMAIEAIEGTDACIKRGIQLGSNNVVVCKAAHAKHNSKFDLPTLGPSSLEHLKPGDVKAIAWISSNTLICQKELFIRKAHSLGIALISVAA